METSLTLVPTIIQEQESLKHDNEALKNIIKIISAKITEHRKTWKDRDFTMINLMESSDRKDKEYNDFIKTVTDLMSQNAELFVS